MDGKPLVITAAITGSAITSRSDTPYVPITHDEIVDAAVASSRAGAAIVHLHARDENGIPTQRGELYKLLTERIQAAGCDAILNLSAGSAGGRADFDQRLECIALAPEMATLDCGSMNFGDERVFANPFHFLRRAAMAMGHNGVVPEIEVFDSGMIINGLRLVEEGLISAPGVWQLCLGVRGGAPADLGTVAHLLSRLPAGAIWTLLGVGRHQLELTMIAIAAGGHVRTGLEDNLYFRRGELATSNEQLVARVVELAAHANRPVASASEARALIGIS